MTAYAEDGPFEIELGVPVADETTGDDAIEAWAARERVVWDTWEAAGGTAQRARVERYLVGPPEETDPQRWETELAVLIR